MRSVRSRAAVTLAAVCTLACNEIGGIHEPVPAKAGAPATPGDPKGLARFEGHWTAPNGTITVKCPSATEKSATVATKIFITRGTSSDLVATDDTDCALALNVTGDVAVFVPGQKCTVESTTARNETETDAYTLASGTIELDANGRSAHAHFSGKVTVTIGANSITCDFERNDPHTRE